MTALSEVQRHIGALSELRDVVGAMRALAGLRMREAQQALPGVRRYAAAIAAGLAAAMRLDLPPGLGGARAVVGRAMIVCLAEHGFVGGFNERVLEAALPALTPADQLYLLGSRGAALAAERGCSAGWTGVMPTRVSGTPHAIMALTGSLYEAIARGRLQRIDCIYARYQQGASPSIEQHTLLPLDTAAVAAAQLPERSNAPAPVHYLSPAALLEGLAGEYLFALLTEATVESLASENAARFAAMDAAHENVTRQLDNLQSEERQLRQDEITAELLDLIVGAQASG